MITQLRLVFMWMFTLQEFCELGSLERVVKSGALLYKAGKPDLVRVVLSWASAAPKTAMLECISDPDIACACQHRCCCSAVQQQQHVTSLRGRR